MRRPPILASILAVLALGILCSLGIWQIQRLQWKEGIISAIEIQKALDPFEHALSFSDLIDDNLYQRGFLTGHFDHDYEIALGPRVQDKQVGYHLYTPLVLDDGSSVFVHRGWIPDTLKEPSSRFETLIEGRVSASGMIVQAPQPNFFTPDNDDVAGDWYKLDLEDYKTRAGRDVAPVVLLAEESSAYVGTQIMRASHFMHIRNDHLGYAFFWFSLSGVFVIIFYLRFLKP